MFLMREVDPQGLAYRKKNVALNGGHMYHVVQIFGSTWTVMTSSNRLSVAYKGVWMVSVDG